MMLEKKKKRIILLAGQKPDKEYTCKPVYSEQNQTSQTKIMQEEKVRSTQEVQNCGKVDFETKMT